MTATTAKTPLQHPSFIAALATAQGEMPRVAKAETANVQTKTGHRYQYSYASLADIHAAILPVLSRHGLAWITMPTIREDGRYVLRCELAHVSESRTCEMPLPSMCTPQELGSALTYARRYALCSMVGIAPDDEDDDSAAAQAATVAAPQQQRPAPQDHRPRRQPKTAAQPQDIVRILDEALKTTDRDWHVRTWKTAPRSAQLPLSQLTDHHRRCLRAAGLDMAKPRLTVEDALNAIGFAVKSTDRTVAELVAPPDSAIEEMGEMDGAEDLDGAEAAAEGQ
jgi:hypothetical protein